MNQLGIADVVSAQASKWLQLPSDGATGHVVHGSFEELVEPIIKDVRSKAVEYGIIVWRFKWIGLPDRMREVINRTREAFLLPIQSEQKACRRFILAPG